MTSHELRQKFIDFFKERGHAVVPSSSLVPDDPSVLLTTAGMQQFKKYFTGELTPDFKLPDGSPARGVVSIQKSFRTSDIDEVGDESHNTFFEMLGNFSFGGYWKEEAIKYAHEFLVKELGLEIDYVTVFEGDKEVPVDEESEKIWQSLGVKNIKRLNRSENFWGPTGNEGPCGPTTEIFVKGLKAEVWNLVFNEYYSKNGKLEPLETKGVDTGMGLERLATAVQSKKNIFETDLFDSIIEYLSNTISQKSKRIIADHTRAVVFLIRDGVIPSNKGQGSVLRGLILRVIVHLKEFQFLVENEKPEDMEKWDTLETVAEQVLKVYSQQGYEDLLQSQDKIQSVIKEEEARFKKAYTKGRKKVVEYENKAKDNGSWKISGSELLDLRSTYGLPLEVIKDLVSKSIKLDIEGAKEAFKEHQEISRAGAEKKFGGHGLLLDTGELKAVDERELKIVTRLHTATHLLQAALREILGPEVKQNGSDITAARTRFDFFFPRKLTDEEKRKVEDLVNQKIAEDLLVSFVELPLEEAKKTGALYFFKAKYSERVKVYFIGKDLDSAFSKEFCGGPHVSKTSEVGKFKILKEESVSSGIRRIRAVVE